MTKMDDAHWLTISVMQLEHSTGIKKGKTPLGGEWERRVA
jgi:hypothetical protein